MPETIVLFEDASAHHFYPLNLIRPVCDLASGVFTFYERIRALYPQHEIEILCRPELDALVRESGRRVFDEADLKNASGYVFMNARAAFGGGMDFPLDTAVIEDDTLVYLHAAGGQLGGFRARDFLSGACAEKARALGFQSAAIPYRIYNYIWEISNSIARAIEHDLSFMRPDFTKRPLPGAEILGERLLIADDAVIDPACVLDARQGSIVIGSGARIAQRSVVTGPALIASGARLDGARLHGGAYVGEGCRIGGEVESSVILAWSNKHHDGFLGHAYLGSWVNIGAMTTCSDLRNDYKEITVSLEGRAYASGASKLGCVIGDHAKLGIGLLLNTGLVAGLGANLFFDGALIKKEVPSFAWGGREPYTEYRLEKFLDTAQTVMSRRGMALSGAMRERLISLHANKANIK